MTDTVNSLLAQAALPRKVIIIANEPEDVEAGVANMPGITVLFDTGSSAQKRNLALAHAEGAYILFADDDIEFHPMYLSEAASLLDDFPAVVAFSGKLLQDGAISRLEAKELVRKWNFQEHWRGHLVVDGKYVHLHACNLIIRRSVLARERFDDQLPCYSFGEDYDLWARVRRYGIIGHYDRCVAVHLKAPSGRLDRKRLAWSIMANNWHFLRKGATHLSPGLAHLRFFWTFIHIGREQLFLDLKERNLTFPGSRGVLLAFVDLVAGRLQPGRLEELQ